MAHFQWVSIWVWNFRSICYETLRMLIVPFSCAHLPLRQWGFNHLHVSCIPSRCFPMVSICRTEVTQWINTVLVTIIKKWLFCNKRALSVTCGMRLWAPFSYLLIHYEKDVRYLNILRWSTWILVESDRRFLVSSVTYMTSLCMEYLVPVTRHTHTKKSLAEQALG